MAAIFRVHGPFEVQRSGEDHICITPGCSDFWSQAGARDLAKERGCYVFAIQAADGIRPVYVGKTTRSFDEECFTYRNVLSHYQHAALATSNGVPVIPLMFLLVLDREKGPPNIGAIAELEWFLIHNAAARNPRLSNIQGTKMEEWGIAGIIRGGRGRTSDDAESFRNMMALESDLARDEEDAAQVLEQVVNATEQSVGQTEGTGDEGAPESLASGDA